MKNIILHQHQWKQIPSIGNYQQLCLDPDSSDLYLLADSKLYYVNKHDSKDPVLIWASSEVLDALHIEFLSVTRKISIAIRNGTLLELSVEGVPEIEEVGECANGLAALSWSPDQELLVLVTCQLSVVLMTSDYFPLTEYNLQNVDFGEKNFINVGWGKKETQFHGSEGKQAAKAKQLEQVHIDSEALPVVSWRGDSTLFCVGFSGPSGHAFKVFNREGVLQYTSETVGGLGAPLAWRPSGNLIAATQALPNKYVVTFFEKNGLQHGCFNLPFNFDEVKVEKLSWSNDSEVLCVHAVNAATGDKSILLYTIGNYHWYLKQSLQFSKNSGPVHVIWDCSIGKGKTLHVLTENGKIMYYRWESTINHSYGTDVQDGSCVSVIDGEKILFTNFRGICIPPPMASLTIQCPKLVNFITYAPINSVGDQKSVDSNMFLAILDDNSFIICKPEFEGVRVREIKTFTHEKLQLDTVMENQNSVPLFLHHWCWLNDHTLVCAYTENNNSRILIVNLGQTNDSLSYELKVKKELFFDNVIISLDRISDHNILVQCINGSLSSLNIDEGIPNLICTLPQACIKLKNLIIEEESFTFGLTDRNRFYINTVEVANNVTSFFLHSNFLLMTTLQHRLLTIKLSRSNLGFLVKNKAMTKDHMPEFVLSRKVERGSKLIVAVPKDTRTVLQLPRGNLEIIQPRSLSLHLIKNFLDERNYKSAFELFRRQRINLNLMVDHNPKLFLDNVKTFIEDISNPMWISLFVSDLSNEDVTKTMYSSSYSDETKVPLENKIDVVCSLLRDELEKHEKCNSFIYPILATYVKKHSVKDLESALLKVKQVKSSENKNLPISADEALKYLLYLIDVNELYDIALGLYDFDLVMYIARRSQKDPKEYIPFLNELNKMEENYRFYTIDKHLKRFDSALKHIVKCDDKFNECLKFIEEHNLFKNALSLYDRKHENYSKVAFAYGENLMKSRNYSEAAVMFRRGGDLEKTLESLKEAHEWRECVALVKDLKYNAQETLNLYRNLAESLKELHRFSEAGEIFLYYVKDVENAVETYIQGRLWSDAQKSCKVNDRADLLETHVKPGLSECMTNLSTQIATISESTIKYTARLLLLNATREQFAERQNDLMEDDEQRLAQCDLYSDTSSVAGSAVSRSTKSSKSGRSFRSSKNRRKHERKLISLKEGNAFERPALISALHGLVVQAFALREDVKNVCRAALDFQWDKQASELQKSLSILLTNLQDNFDKIWTHDLFVYNEPSTSQTSDELVANFNNKNSDLGPEHLDQHLRMRPIIPSLNWEFDVLK